jgi:hypothetical protein
MILTITTEGELLLSGKPEAVKAANICTDGIFNSEYRNCLNTLPPEEVTIAYQTLDFTTWRQGGPLANGLWKLQDGNSAIFQSINGNPTYFLSPEIYKYGTFKGSFQVKTNSDDDWIGFVFGYKNDYDYYLIDWKKGNQSPARKGWVLSNYFGGTPVWGHESYNPGETVFFKNYGDGWIAYTSYDIVLEIAEAGYIRVKVKKSSEPDSKYQTIVTQQFDSSKGVPSGKIGFYNFSQANVYYNNFNATNLKTLSCSKYGTKWYLNNNDECEQTSLPDCETGYTKTNEGFCILSTTDGSVPQNDISIASVCNNGSKLGILNGNICVQQTECLETCPRGYVKIPGTNKCSQQTLYCSNGVLDEGNGLCKVTNTIWSVNKSYLQCDNDADTLYGKYQTDNYYCKSDVTEMVDGSGEKIFKVNKKPVINVPFSVVEKISDKFTRPLYVYAIDNKGVSSLDIKSLEMTFHYAKLDERQREYIEYSCPENTYPTQWFVTETPYYNFTPIDLITKNEERLLSGEDPSSFMPCMQDKFLDCENGDTTNNVFQGNQNIIYYDSIQQKNWNLKGEKSNEN